MFLEERISAIENDLIGYLKVKAFLPEDVQIRRDESLTESGIIDSIGLIQLIDHIEEAYGIEIPLEQITPENFDTLEGIEGIIRQRMDARRK